MAFLNYKQKINYKNLNPEITRDLLKDFKYPATIDKKGKLRISCSASDIKLGFEPQGDFTIIGVTSTPMKPWIFILFLIFICIFVLPGFIFALIFMFTQRDIYMDAVKVINDKINSTNQRQQESSILPIDISTKIQKLRELKEQGILTEDEFDKKKNEIIDKI